MKRCGDGKHVTRFIFFSFLFGDGAGTHIGSCVSGMKVLSCMVFVGTATTPSSVDVVATAMLGWKFWHLFWLSMLVA